MVDNLVMEPKTAQRILDIAQDIVRNRGYSAFSYADISKQVGIRKASIHYHFPSKDELVKQLVTQYRQRMMKACDRIAQSPLDQQIIQFANLYRDGLEAHQICLCAMLAADFAVLPQSIQDEIQVFFSEIEAWLVNLLQQGQASGLWDCQPSAKPEAKGLIAMLQGAQLMARSSADSTATFEQMVYPLLAVKFSKD